MTAYTTDWAKNRQEIRHAMDLHCSTASRIVNPGKASNVQHKIRPRALARIQAQLQQEDLWVVFGNLQVLLRGVG